MRVKMLRTRNYTPREERRITVKYKGGHDYTVKRTWGEDMVRDGDAEELVAPPREEAQEAVVRVIRRRKADAETA